MRHNEWLLRRIKCIVEYVGEQIKRAKIEKNTQKKMNKRKTKVKRKQVSKQFYKHTRFIFPFFVSLLP